MNLATMTAVQLLDAIARSGVSVFKLNGLGCLVVQTHIVNPADAALLAGAMIEKTKRPIIELPEGFTPGRPANVN